MEDSNVMIKQFLSRYPDEDIRRCVSSDAQIKKETEGRVVHLDSPAYEFKRVYDMEGSHRAAPYSIITGGLLQNQYNPLLLTAWGSP